MSEQNIKYLEKQVEEARVAGDQEAEFEARVELANERAWKRREEEGHW